MREKARRSDGVGLDVIRGLARPQKELSPKYFYDQRGSELFEEITHLPEYYPTRTEAGLLRSFGASWIRSVGARALVELGAGNAEKTRILLRALGSGATYVPVDISEQFLQEVAIEIARDFPDLAVRPVAADITQDISTPHDLPAPAVLAFLGSTIGNFERDTAVHLLSNLRASARHGDYVLLGADLKKDVEVLERAYNDARGVTAEFNLNILRALNTTIGTDFDIESFEHRAFYNEKQSRIEMHLVSRVPQRVNIPLHGAIDLAAGETIRTEISTKYDRGTIEEMFNAAGLEMDRWEEDERGWYALAVGVPR